MRSPATRGRKKNLAKFRLRRGVRLSFGVTKRRRVEVFFLFAGSHIYSWPTICSSAPHGGPPPRPPAFNCTLFHTGIRSGTALALHVAVMDLAVPSLATPQPACRFRSTHRAP